MPPPEIDKFVKNQTSLSFVFKGNSVVVNSLELQKGLGKEARVKSKTWLFLMIGKLCISPSNEQFSSQFFSNAKVFLPSYYSNLVPAFKSSALSLIDMIVHKCFNLKITSADCYHRLSMFLVVDQHIT